MSTSSKKKKNKFRPIAIETVLPNAVVRSSTTSWAEEVEDEFHLTEFALKKIASITLPTAPRAARDLVIDESKIPPDGPFRAYMSNLPFETTEEDVTNLFSQLKINKIELPRDRSDRMKGFGYIEFWDKSSLLVALQEGELTLKGRTVRISLPSDDENRGSRGGTSFTRNRDMSDRFGGSDRPTEWRAAAPIPHDPEKSASKSGGFTRQQNFRSDGGGGGGGGGPFRESRSGFTADSAFTRGPFRERDRDDQLSDRGGSSRSFTTKRFGDRDRDDRGGRGSIFGRKFDRDDREIKREPAPEREEPKQRPKIELQPRSKPLDTNPAPAALPSSIFGAAKPVDTARREQEIEEKLESAPPLRNRPTSPMSNATPNRSRSSSVSSVSSMRRQLPDSTETANNEPSKSSSRPDAESEKPKTAEFKEPAPPPPVQNVWQRRSEVSAAAAAAQAAEKISSNVVDSTVIDDTSNGEKTPRDRSGERPHSPAEDRASSSPAPADEAADKRAAATAAADSEPQDRAPVTASAAAAAPSTTTEKPQWTTYSSDTYGSDAPAGGGGGSRYEGGGSYSGAASDRSAGKYSSFGGRDRRGGDSRRGGDTERRGGGARNEYRSFGGGGNRSESGGGGPFGARRDNRDGPGGGGGGSQFRNRNGTAPRREESRGGGAGGYRDQRNEHGSSASQRSSASSSTSNLRDEAAADRGEEQRKAAAPAANDERLTTSGDSAAGAAADAACNDEGGSRGRPPSPPAERARQPSVEERLQGTDASGGEPNKPLENGDESGSPATRGSASDAAAPVDPADDGSFSSGKSRKKDKKRKTERGEDAAADKDILKPIENDRKANNQKDEKKASDSQVNDKTTNNNNTKGKESNRSKKAAKKSKDIQDAASLPKQKEEKAPNFQGSNRYQLLEDDS